MANVNPNWLGVTPAFIPSQTQLNGTGALVDIVPRIFKNLNAPTGEGVALSNTDGASTTVYTSPSVEAGTYQVSVSFEIENDGTVVGWSNAEQMLLSISSTGITTRPLLSLQPAYFNQFNAANDPIYITLTGLVTTTGGTLLCNVIRYGVPSTNKQGSVYCFTAQKIA
jgi:hypothetical protein